MKSSGTGEDTAMRANVPLQKTLRYLAVGILCVALATFLPHLWPPEWRTTLREYQSLGELLFLLVSTRLLYRTLRALPAATAVAPSAEALGPSWRTIIEAFGAVILLVDEAGIIIDCNEQALRAYHYSREELIGQPYDMLRISDETAQQNAWESGMIGKGHLFEETHQSHAGNTFPVSVSVRTLSVGGRLQHFIDVRDITDRKRTEAALAQERFLFNTLMENTPDTIFFKTRDGKYLRVNRELAVQLGQQSSESLIGKTDFDVLPASEARDASEEERGIVETGQPVIGSVKKAINTENEDRWVSLTKLPLRDADGRVIGTFGIARDISDYVHAEEALRRQERFLASVFASIQDGISVLDTDLNILQVNPAMDRWFAEDGPLIGRKCYQAYHGRENACEECPSARTIRTGNADSAYLPHYGAEGKLKHWFELHSFPLVDADSGQVSGVIEYVHDITERKAIEDELRQKTAELADSNAELQQFAYVASHDLQEPLRMVASYVQLLERRYKGQLDEDADEFIAFAVDGASRMKSLINDLLTYSRVGTQGKPFETTDCNEVMKRVLTNLQMAINEQEATITLDPLPTVTADPTQLHQLFQNLIGNAIKFHRPGDKPAVHVSATVDSKGATFTVQDNRIGIDVKYTDRIFAIFQRLHAKGEYPGTGIGLAICKKIAERHGGQIWVESEVGKGATFYVSIPKNPHKARAAKAEHAAGKTVETAG